jgi:para-nitrobenzyl esterase
MSAPSLVRTLSLRSAAVGLVAVAAMIASARIAAGATVITTTDTGPVEGLVAPTLTEFLGIPYAAPPVGDLRWQPPQPPAPWSTPRDATVFGNHCPQAFSPFGLESDTEDCLLLNVYVPLRHGFPSDARRHRPVMVWIHGGAFSVGESDVYDPVRLVAQDVVVVTINYRLGALGFLAHPALSVESPDGISGNYGLLDQQAALRWVQRNIASFGGNPRKVTIFGESAGGFSVHAHLASPLAAGLFQRAIVESGAFFTQPTLDTAETTGSAFATAVGCSDQTASCLRAVPVDQVLANWGTGLTSTTPVIDGVVLPQPLRDLFATGHFNRVPVIEGSNHDEFRLFVALLYDLVSAPLAADQYDAAVASLLQVPLGIAQAITSHYPLSAYDDSPDLALGAIGTDAAFACNAQAVAHNLARFVRTYTYEFADENAPPILPPASFPYGAAHGLEIQYLFNLPAALNTPPMTSDQQQLSNFMLRYWTRFARSGRPRAIHSPRWPKQSDDLLLSLQAPTPQPESRNAFNGDHKCYTLWNGLLGN